MKKSELKIGMTVQLPGRVAEIIKIQRTLVKCKPAGESSRWIKIEDLKEVL